MVYALYRVIISAGLCELMYTEMQIILTKLVLTEKYDFKSVNSTLPTWIGIQFAFE